VSNDELQERLLELALAGRPDQLVDLALADAVSETGGGPEMAVAARRALNGFEGLVATLALAEPAVAPRPDVRKRLMSTLRARSARPGSRRAVLVIDMLNDHLMPGRPLEVPRARDIVPALNARLDAARRDGVPVVYICDRHEPDDADLDTWRTHNVAGSDGAEVWAPLAPKPSDRIVHKPTYSAFSRSDLADVLKELRVDTLVLTGCLTELGVLATATDALQRGYAVEVPPDAQAGSGPSAEQMALTLLRVMAPYGAARRELLDAIAV